MDIDLEEMAECTRCKTEVAADSLFTMGDWELCEDCTDEML